MANRTMLHIGFGNTVMCSRIVALVDPDSAPVKRLISEGRDVGIVIDATHGRRTRSVVVTDANRLFLSSLTTETLTGRLDPGLAIEREARETDD